MLQLFSLQRWRESFENGEGDSSSSATGEHLMELIMAFNGDGDASDSGGDVSGPEDFFS